MGPHRAAEVFLLPIPVVDPSPAREHKRTAAATFGGARPRGIGARRGATLRATPHSHRRQGAKLIQRRYALTFLFVSTACAQTELTDEALRDAGLNLGAASSALAQSPPDAPLDVLERQLARIEEDLALLARGHDALGLAGDSLPPPAASPVPASGNRDVTWDGHVLDVDVDGLDGNAVRADGSLRAQGYRVDVPAWQGAGTDPCHWGTPLGDSNGSVECPPLIDRAITFTRPGVGLTVHATFGITLDGDACAAGGQVELDYVLTDAAGRRGGTLEASYEGCGRIRILTPK